MNNLKLLLCCAMPAVILSLLSCNTAPSTQEPHATFDQYIAALETYHSSSKDRDNVNLAMILYFELPEDNVKQLVELIYTKNKYKRRTKQFCIELVCWSDHVKKFQILFRELMPDDIAKTLAKKHLDKILHYDDNLLKDEKKKKQIRNASIKEKIRYIKEEMYVSLIVIGIVVEMPESYVK